MNGWGARVLVLLAIVGSYWLAYQHGRTVERQVAATASATHDRDERQAEVQGERAARAEEQRRAEAQEEVRAHAEDQRETADAAGAGADAAGQRLHNDAGQFAAAISCTGTDTAAVARGQAATRAAMVLSDLLRRADERAGELAKAYDLARVAGEQCAAEYDALRSNR